tara:strand:+ start:3335 stop:4144 length:810 start_codon:yes stop_codon:yes gene_type:complete
MPVDGRRWIDVLEKRSSSLYDDLCVKSGIGVNNFTLRMARLTLPTDLDVCTCVALPKISKDLLVSTRQFFHRLLSKNNVPHLTARFCQMSTYLMFFTNVLLSVNSHLLDNMPLLVTTVIHLARKIDDQKYSSAFKDILRIHRSFCNFVEIDYVELTKHDIIKAESEILKASNFTIPHITSYEIMFIFFKRSDIESIGKCALESEIVSEAWKMADNLLFDEIMLGNDSGFLTARNIVKQCLTTPCGGQFSTICFSMWPTLNESVCRRRKI